MSISLKPLNVWLVDDDASIRWVLERALRQGGMSPTAFDQADSALAALRRDRPDVLITDIRMPGRSGLELLTLNHNLRLLISSPPQATCSDCLNWGI